MKESKHKNIFGFTLFLFKWFLIFGVGVALLPITFGVLLIWLVDRKVTNSMAKIALAVLIGIPTLFIGFAWVLGMTQKSVDLPKTELLVETDSSVFPSETTTPTPMQSTTPVLTLPPTVKPTPKPPATPNISVSTTKNEPTPNPNVYTAPTTTPTTSTGGSYTCDCSKTCTQISTCAEAQYQLNVCGCRARDGDKDGIACDSAPLYCQN